jgi:hypothetical protein
MPDHFEPAPHADGVRAGQYNLFDEVAYRYCAGVQSIDEYFQVFTDRQARSFRHNPATNGDEDELVRHSGCLGPGQHRARS